MASFQNTQLAVTVEFCQQPNYQLLVSSGVAGTKGFDVDLAKQKYPREVELKILKNRQGATGKLIDFNYYPLFNCFEPESEE